MFGSIVMCILSHIMFVCNVCVYIVYTLIITVSVFASLNNQKNKLQNTYFGLICVSMSLWVYMCVYVCFFVVVVERTSFYFHVFLVLLRVVLCIDLNSAPCIFFGASTHGYIPLNAPSADARIPIRIVWMKSAGTVA